MIRRAAMTTIAIRRTIEAKPAIPTGPEGLRKLLSVRKVTVLEAEFPARSTTVSVTVCAPSERPEAVYEVALAARVWGVPPSTRTSTRSIPEVESVAVQVTVAEELETTAPSEGLTIESVGFTVSTVTSTDRRTVFPARSTAVTRMVWGPSATAVNVYDVAVPATV
jgi:hypothetical protein